MNQHQHMLKMFTCALLFVTFSLLPFTSAQAAKKSKNDLNTKTRQLKQVNAQITRLQQVLVNAKDKRKTLNQELKGTEISIGQLARTLNSTQQQLATQQTTLNKLQQQAGQQQTKLNQQQQLLAQQVRANYQLGKYQYVKLVLNQQDPNAVSRYLTYYKYINQARIKLITEINDTLSALLDSKEKILTHTKQLQTLLAKQKQQRLQLLNQQDYRQKVLVRLNASINTKDKKLSVLTSNKSRLEKLISTLKRSSWQQQPTLPFSAMQRKLPWPTRGRLVNLFGKQIDNSQMTYNGVLIKAPMGQKIRSIYPGKVVFSNWMRGFGLLLIIEHGHGYMTLYAHNHSLYKKTGDWVNVGDLIATVGHSGGGNQNGLYFEIRRQGKPINPLAWCSSTRKFA